MTWIVPPESQYIQGMKRQLLIDTANRRTGKVAEGKLNLDGEFLEALQSFCLERYWWWRQKSFMLQTEIGVSVYDMADPVSPVNALDCQKMVKMCYFPTNTQSPAIIPPDRAFMEVHPMFDPDHQMAAMQDDVTSGPPANYFMVPGSTTQLFINPIPNDVYLLQGFFWAVPNGTIDTLEDMIPLVPAHLQRVLMLNLQCNFLLYAGGKEMQTMLVGTQQKYAIELSKAAQQKEFADGRRREWKSEEHAIRSHG